MIKVGSDCAGVGAFTQALKRLEIDYIESFACDFDFFARQTYLLNFGTKEDIELSNSKEHKKYADGVKRIALSSEKPTIEENAFLLEANEFAKKFSFYYPFNMYQREIPQEPCDIYISSVPCQAFSMAGKRLGKEDKRGVLFFNSLEFIQENKPRYFIFENVKGLLSHDKVDPKAQYGRTFQEWINYLGGKSVNGVHTFFPYEDAVPYHIYFQVLNAKDYNIPQNRERIFIIGIRDDEDNDFQFPKHVPLTKRLKDVLEPEVDEKYFLSDKMLDYLTSRKDNFNNGNINFKDENSVASTITKSSSSLDISDNIIRLGNVNPSGNGMNGNVFSEDGISPTLSTNKGEGIKIVGYTRDAKGKVTSRHEKEISGTIHTSSGGGGNTDQFVKVGTWRTHEDGKGFREMEDNLCPTIPARAREDGSGQPVIKIGAIRGRNPENPKSRQSGLETEQMLEINENGTSNALTTVQKDNVVVISANTSKGYDEAEEEEDSINFSVPNSKTRRGRVGKKVSQTLDTQCNQGIVTRKPSKQEKEEYEGVAVHPNSKKLEFNGFKDENCPTLLATDYKAPKCIQYNTQRIRRLTPLECFKLMDFNFGIDGVPDFVWNVSDSQAYKQAGNSIAVGVLAAIIEKLKF